MPDPGSASHVQLAGTAPRGGSRLMAHVTHSLVGIRVTMLPGALAARLMVHRAARRDEARPVD